MRKTTTITKCENCGTDITLPFWMSKNTRFCSPKCSGQSIMKKNTQIKNCKTCSKEFAVRKSSKKIYCCHKCYGLSKAGKPNPWGNGGGNTGYRKDINLIVKSERKDLDTQYRRWMLAVKKRDCWKCRIANKDCNGRLEAHHILPWRDYPELRYEINNGITLCLAHHPRMRSEEKRLSPYFMELVSVSKE